MTNPQRASSSASWHEADDATLAEGVKDGEPGAFEQLVRRHGARLLAICRRYLRNETEARDALQDTYLQIHRNIGQFTGSGQLAGWMSRIAVNTSLMRLRAFARRAEDSIEALLPEFDETGCRVERDAAVYRTAEEILRAKDVREKVRTAIDQLPDSHRLILLLRDIEGFTTAEAAAALELSEGAAKVRLHRARSALKKLLEPVLAEEETP